MRSKTSFVKSFEEIITSTVFEQTEEETNQKFSTQLPDTSK